MQITSQILPVVREDSLARRCCIQGEVFLCFLAGKITEAVSGGHLSFQDMELCHSNRKVPPINREKFLKSIPINPENFLKIIPMNLKCQKSVPEMNFYKKTIPIYPENFQQKLLKPHTHKSALYHEKDMYPKKWHNPVPWTS